jgi:hypothetical protein
VRVLDNLAFDVSVHDNSVPEPFFQTFLVTRAEQFTVKLGSATRLAIDRQTLLRISYGTIYSGFVVADIPLVQDGVFLRGIGPLIRDPNLTAMWTVSLLEPVPFAAGVN